MDHDRVQGELQAYLDGALPPEAARAVRAHLEGCASCRAELALLREVDAALRAWPVLPEPEGLAARVMAGISAAPRRAAPPPWVAPRAWLRAHWSEVLLGAALVATIVVLAVSLRAWSVQEALDLRFWDLQARRALAEIERVWYAMRVDAPGTVGAGSSRPLARYVTQFYYWVAGVIALLAGIASVGMLAQQWRRGMRFSA